MIVKISKNWHERDARVSGEISRGNTETNLKNMWKKVFENTDPAKGPTKETIFNAMTPELKVSLFKVEDETEQLLKFESMIQNQNSDLYKFIKAE